MDLIWEDLLTKQPMSQERLYLQKVTFTSWQVCQQHVSHRRLSLRLLQRFSENISRHKNEMQGNQLYSRSDTYYRRSHPICGQKPGCCPANYHVWLGYLCYIDVSLWRTGSSSTWRVPCPPSCHRCIPMGAFHTNRITVGAILYGLYRKK